MGSDAILASYSDFKFIKTRNTVQIICEIPVEASTHALELLGGMPSPGSEVMVAIARLRPEAGIPTTEPEALPSPRKQLKPSARAGILCNDVRFQVFANERGYKKNATGFDVYRQFVLEWCGIKSRKELDTDTAALGRFDRLHAEFDLWCKE